MLRLLLAAALLLVLAAATVLVLAANYLPWWGFLLTAVGLVVAFWLGVKLFTGRLVQALFSLPFRAKGAALRGAKVEVHGVSVAPPPDELEDDDRERGLRFYQLDATITPTNYAGPFKFWEPGELVLVPSRAKVRLENSDDTASARVFGVEVVEEGEAGPDVGTKYFGPQRLRLKIGVPPEAGRSLAFVYYFEKFGTVTLPDEPTAEGEGAAERDRDAESARP